MALSEIQQTTKAEFCQKIQAGVNKLNGMLLAVKELTDFLVDVDQAELDRMGITTADQVKLSNYRTALSELNSFAAGNPVTPSVILNAVIDGLRSM